MLIRWERRPFPPSALRAFDSLNSLRYFVGRLVFPSCGFSVRVLQGNRLALAPPARQARPRQGCRRNTSWRRERCPGGLLGGGAGGGSSLLCCKDTRGRAQGKHRQGSAHSTGAATEPAEQGQGKALLRDWMSSTAAACSSSLQTWCSTQGEFFLCREPRRGLGVRGDEARLSPRRARDSRITTHSRCSTECTAGLETNQLASFS